MAAPKSKLDFSALSNAHRVALANWHALMETKLERLTDPQAVRKYKAEAATVMAKLLTEMREQLEKAKAPTT